MWTSVLRRAIVEPVYLKGIQSPKRRYWKELEETQYLPEEVLKKKQWERLIALFNYVYENNPYYRNRFDSGNLLPSDIKSYEDVKKLPILTKEEIRQNTPKMISQGYTPENLLKFKTGGSTGKPLEIYLTEECSEIRNACARRHDRWTGWEVGEPIGAVWGNPKIPTNIRGKLKQWLLWPTIYLDTMSVTEESVRQFAKDWEKTKPTLLFGHAHSLYVLAQYVKHLSIRTIHPKAIISSSMMLIPQERKTIENVFGIKVFDRYGCEEVSLIASECERHEGMHLNIEHLYIEFLRDDGTEASPGEPGNIIVTDLMNRAMPFIRYQVGDVGVVTDRKCSCGRGLPLIEEVTGRVADFLIKKDGTKVAGVSLIENTLTKIPGIDQMQILQTSVDSIVLNIVAEKDFNSESREELVTYFKKIFGENAKISINQIREIKPEQSGKYRFSICNIPHAIFF